MATLTAGAGKTYSTPESAVAAASANDTIQVFVKDTSNTAYAGNIAFDKSLTMVGMDPGITIRGSMTYTAVDSVIKIQNLMFHDTAEVALGDIGTTIIWIDRCHFWQYRRFRNANTNNTGSLRITNSYVTLDTSLGFWLDSATASFRYQFYNSVLNANAANLFNFRIQTAGGADVYNCVIYHTAAEAATGGGVGMTYNYNHCIFPVENSAYSPGANNEVRTWLNAGFAANSFSAGQIFDGRILAASELPGTTTAGAVDLTALYTTDIDGRARPATAAGYAIGCSYGFRLYETPVYTAPANVRLGTDRGDGVPGTLDLPAVGDVRALVKFDGETQEGTLEVKDLTFAEEAARNTDPGVDNTINGIGYKHLDANRTGLWRPMLLENQVLTPNEWGLVSAPLIGTAISGTVEVPEAPLLSVVSTDSQTVVINAVVTGTDTVSLRYRSAQTWSAPITRIGTGQITVTGLQNNIRHGFIAQAYRNDIPSPHSNEVLATPKQSHPLPPVDIFSVNPNWARWIFASVSKHFDDGKGIYPLYIEGQYKEAKMPKDYLELRVDGPWSVKVDACTWEQRVLIDVIIQSNMDDSNYHKIHEMVGYVSSLFTKIQLYKYGAGEDDDGSHFGCIKLIADSRERQRLRINHFGQLRPGMRLMQASVGAWYSGKLTKE